MNESTPQNKAFSNAKLLYGMMATFVIVTILFYLGVYFDARVWQALLAAGVLGVVIFLLPVSYNFFRRGQQRYTAIILILGMIVGYGVNELVWQGLWPYHMVGGTLLLLLVLNLLLPRAYGLWALFLGGYLSYLALINIWPPVPRVYHGNIPMLLIYAIGTNVLLVVVFGGITAYFALGKRIRTRMMILFTMLVGLPLLIAGGLSSFQTGSISQQQATTQLEFDRVLRQTEIKAWMDNIKINLEQLIPSPEESDMLYVLTNRGPEPGYSLLRANLSQSLGGLSERSAAFWQIYLLNEAGTVVFSTDRQLEEINYATQNFFVSGLEGYYTTPVSISPITQQPVFQMSFPIVDEDHNAIGVLAANINIDELNEILNASTQGSQTGEAVLLNEQSILVSPSRFNSPIGNIYPLSTVLFQALQERQTGSNVYFSYRKANVLGSYTWLDFLGVMLVVEKGEFEARLPTIRAVLLNVSVIVVSLGLALIAAWFVSIRIAHPINSLAETANLVAAGNLNLVATVEQEDEIGALARAFNSMTAQLSSQVTSLEQRVADRTADLEQRSVQLQVAAEVARDASAAQDFDDLIQRAVDLVRQRFGFYHAGIFLLDEMGEYSVLRAATGDAGQQMIANGHKLKLGEEGMVGFVAARGIPRIALDVGDDAIHFRNPHLPLTRSEMALPLKVGVRVIGVLDVQSDKEAAFTQEDIVILQTMADQLAVAIENARLLGEVQNSLVQLEALYGSYSQSSWRKITTARAISGYQYDTINGVSALAQVGGGDGSENLSSAVHDQEPAIIPLKVRGQKVGSLKVYPTEEKWSDEQILLLMTLGERVSQAMESARLYEESRQSAATEQLISAITARMRATMDIDTILQTTVREIRQAFDLHEVEVRLEANDFGQAAPEPTVAGN